jgi:hypothetical protein
MVSETNLTGSSVGGNCHLGPMLLMLTEGTASQRRQWHPERLTGKTVSASFQCKCQTNALKQDTDILPPLFGQHLFAAVHVQVIGLAAASGTACWVKSRHFVEIVEVSIAPVLCKRSLFKTAACRSCKQVQVVGIYSFHKFGHSNLWRETILQLNLPYLPNTHLWHSVHHESLCAISFDMRKIET